MFTFDFAVVIFHMSLTRSLTWLSALNVKKNTLTVAKL